jgi:hypothetical protein
MKSRILFGLAVMVALSTGLVGTAGIASAHTLGTRPTTYTCTGGDFATGDLTSIPSGTYASIKVKGACAVADGAVIRVLGNVDVAPGAVFDAQSAPSTITVGHNVTAASGSLLGLGCLPNPVGHTTGHPCMVEPNGSSSITVDGSIFTWNADTVLLNGITVDKSVELTGGGGQIPWAIKDNTIGANLIVRHMTPNWIGVIRNKIGRNALLINIQITDGLPPNNDPNPTISVATNTIGQNVICFGLGPAVGGGFGPPNVIGGHALGQCANLTTVPPPSS